MAGYVGWTVLDNGLCDGQLEIAGWQGLCDGHLEIAVLQGLCDGQPETDDGRVCVTASPR